MGDLSKSHAKLDARVDKLYGRAFAADADLVSDINYPLRRLGGAVLNISESR